MTFAECTTTQKSLVLSTLEMLNRRRDQSGDDGARWFRLYCSGQSLHTYICGLRSGNRWRMSMHPEHWNQVPLASENLRTLEELINVHA